MYISIRKGQHKSEACAGYFSSDKMVEGGGEEGETHIISKAGARVGL